MKRRCGIIRITMSLIENIDEYEPMLSALFSKFFPVHIDINMVTRVATYHGYSPGFDGILKGCVVPEYTTTVTWDDGGTCSVSFNRVDVSDPVLCAQAGPAIGGTPPPPPK